MTNLFLVKIVYYVEDDYFYLQCGGIVFFNKELFRMSGKNLANKIRKSTTFILHYCMYLLHLN